MPDGGSDLSTVMTGHKVCLHRLQQQRLSVINRLQVSSGRGFNNQLSTTGTSDTSVDRVKHAEAAGRRRQGSMRRGSSAAARAGGRPKRHRRPVDPTRGPGGA
jgi:TPP-dependent trihydroxycyclohexane-1,2-dione (THcHDO) dehydratase